MTEEATKEEKLNKKKLHVRYEWLDQFRGLIIIFLIISVITWPLSGNFPGSIPPVGPPLLNHGFKYYNGNPALITIIDIGQQIFMFVLGFVAYLAFTSRREKKGVRAAWKHGIIRVAILYCLAFLVNGLFGGLLSGDGIPWDEVLWYGTLANIAIGSFAAYLLTYLMPKSADKRLCVSLGILIIHAVLYTLPVFEHKGFGGGTIPFPFNSLNHAAIAIAATCFSQWYKMDSNDPKVGFKKRILPVSTIFIIIFYCFDWIQPAEHHDATTSLACLAIATSGFLIAVFYGFEKLEFKVPVLSEMGRNMLLLFIFTFVFDLAIGLFGAELRVANPFIVMILVGVLPIAIEAGIAMLLAKWDIKIKI
ncbi:MAG: hypothetical protein EAX91_00995 [Candidatus Lokiarchaeota archaeon]|nr:hypothetical protein [Candidatus Lokiarchaeota archaeon]